MGNMVLYLCCSFFYIAFAFITSSNYVTSTEANGTEEDSRRLERQIGVYELPHREYQGYDGWFNNKPNPMLGITDSPLSRRLPISYTDGVYSMEGQGKPNPFEITWNTMQGETQKLSFKGRTVFLAIFGQQVVDEIVNTRRAGCPVEYEYIDIPEWHEFRTNHPFKKTMPFVRSRYSSDSGMSPNAPRNQVNEDTPWIDGGIVYGTSRVWADALRSFEGGRLADNGKEGEPQFPERNTIGLPMTNLPDPVEHELKDAKRYFKLGNPHGVENPFLLSFGILWFRWHNYWADKFSQETNWSDEKIYQEARRWVIATYQKFVFYDWLPAFLGMTAEELEAIKYTGYKSYVVPTINQEFQAAAMRWGHTLVPPAVLKRKEMCNGQQQIRTCNTYWNAEPIVRADGIEPLLMGMISQIAEREDNIIAPDLQRRGYGPLNFVRRDLMVETILRGRDHGLPDYNTAREALGLKRRDTFLEINPYYNDSSMSGIDKMDLLDLEEVYQGNINNVDIWAGGLFETTAKGPGELFSTIILDQFNRIRDGDRFWFENERNGLFTKDQIRYIHNLTMFDVLTKCTDIPEDAIQKDVFHFIPGDPCWEESENQRVDYNDLENCTGLETYDYFTHSEVSYALTFAGCGVWIVGCIVVLLILVKWQSKITRKKQRELQQKYHTKYSIASVDSLVAFHEATEWKGPRLNEQQILVTFGPDKFITVRNKIGSKTKRQIDLTDFSKIQFYESKDRKRRYVMIVIEREYDLVMRFESEEEKNAFVSDFLHWLQRPDINIEGIQGECREKEMLRMAFTKEDRQDNIEKFLREAFAHVLQLDSAAEQPQSTSSTLRGTARRGSARRGSARMATIRRGSIRRGSLVPATSRSILALELTKTEFAEGLSMKPDGMFVTQMFDLADKDNNGTLSLREFLDMLAIFVKGNPEDKMRFMFNMYDLDNSGCLDRDEFKTMLRSLMAMVNASLEASQMEELIDTMFSASGFENKEELSLEDFLLLMADHKEDFSQAALKIPGMDVNGNGTKKKKGSKLFKKGRPSRKSQIHVNVDIEEKVGSVRKNSLQASLMRKWRMLSQFIENNKLQIFWLTLYNIVVILVFAERAYYFSVEREHKGLRRIAGFGVSITRGAANAMMFTYSSLLITMCRNLITKLRETFLHQYIPFDSALTMHKIIAYWALVFTVIHIVGHAFNFYHINTQPPEDLSCYFSDYFHRTHTLTNFNYWCWNTITGFTGILLVLVFAVMYTFATQFARRRAFRFFWITHNLYIVGYMLTVFHGSGRLVQPPFWWFFFLGPAILFTIDKMISMARRKQQIRVLKAELLPSAVIHLEFVRPDTFDYKSGQWVRIACTELGSSEFHPFTLSSAPHEENLSLHIRAVGPWTINLRQAFDPDFVGDRPYPKLYLDGPYGEGHQDWWTFEVSVLVGGGIGVTPFSSILKDIGRMSSMQQRPNKCKKIYFIWVTRSQKQFEWMVDVIREVEENDANNLVSVHIFITQFYQQFDLRTTMLYVCERHFQKVSERSLFTGLKSATHFGRPDFTTFLGSLSQQYPQVNKIGVFSCGPPGMTTGVEKACVDLNKRDETAFIHHYENF